METGNNQQKELTNGVTSSFIQNKENILHEEEQKEISEKLNTHDQCPVEDKNNVDCSENGDCLSHRDVSDNVDCLNGVSSNDVESSHDDDSSSIVDSSNVDPSNSTISMRVNDESYVPVPLSKGDHSNSNGIIQNGIDEDKDPEIVKNGGDNEGVLVEPDAKNITLHEACKLGNYNLVEDMLKTSTQDVNMTDAEGWSCLHETCIHSCQFTKIAELLLKNGANPNIQDNNGETPLHGAVLFHFVDNIRLLVEHNADFTICNEEGISPLHVAEMTHDEEILTLLGLPLKKKTPNKRRSRLNGRKKVVLLKRTSTLEYTPSPLSSPSILKKRKRNDDEEKDLSSPKKKITFSLSDG